MRRIAFITWLVSVLALVGCGALTTANEGGDVNTATSTAKLRRAPELHSDVWLNGTPTTLSELRGQVVLVDFWTFG